MGEIGLSFPQARALDWVELDHVLVGYETRQQRALAGHRLTALQVRNALAEKPETPAEFLYLPLVDGPRAAGITAASTAALAERMKQRFGTPAAP